LLEAEKDTSQFVTNTATLDGKKNDALERGKRENKKINNYTKGVANYRIR